MWSDVSNYLENARVKQDIQNLRLHGFTTVNGEVVRLYIIVNTDSLIKWSDHMVNR